MTSLTIGFAGTPAFALPCLEALYHSPHHLKAIYTQPDRPAGRGRKMQSSAVKLWGEEHQVPIYQPLNFKDEAAQQEFASLKLDLLIVIAYGLILPTPILTAPKLGCVNVHASILPRWRGASPIQHAILHGDKETGITIMQMDKGMDTGDMLTCVTTPISTHDTSTTLHDRLASLASAPLLETIQALATQQAAPVKQPHEQATYAPKINKEDACIHWDSPVAVIDQLIRAFNPWPIAYTNIEDTVIRVHQAHPLKTLHTAKPGTILSLDANGIVVATKDGALCLEVIQFSGSRQMPVRDWLNAGRRSINVGSVLG